MISLGQALLYIALALGTLILGAWVIESIFTHMLKQTDDKVKLFEQQLRKEKK